MSPLDHFSRKVVVPRKQRGRLSHLPSLNGQKTLLKQETSADWDSARLVDPRSCRCLDSAGGTHRSKLGTLGPPGCGDLRSLLFPDPPSHSPIAPVFGRLMP